MITPEDRDRCEKMLLHYAGNWQEFGHWRCFYKFNEHFRWEPENDWVDAFRLKCYAEDVRPNTTTGEVYDAAKLFLRRSRKLKDIPDEEKRFDTMYFLNTKDGVPARVPRWTADTTKPAFVMKSPESIEHNCDIDIIKNFVFTVKVKSESRFGDFDHVLVEQNYTMNKNAGEWSLIPITEHCVTPCGDYIRAKDKAKFKRILKYMHNLGEHTVSQGQYGIYNKDEVSKLVALAKSIPQTYIGKLYTEEILVKPRDS